MTFSITTFILLCLSLINSCTTQLVDDGLVGTWTTKSKAVFTGPGFYNPVTDKLTEPSHPGISYSFTADGHYEQAYYRAISNRKKRARSGDTTCTDGNSPTTCLPIRNDAMAAWHLHSGRQWFPYPYPICSRWASSHVESLLLLSVHLHAIPPTRTDQGVLNASAY